MSDDREIGVFIARQHATHAKRDVVLPFLSACPSNADIVSKRMGI